MKTQLSIQERLKDLRVENGLTLEQLSQQTKIPASTLGSYESDDYKEIPHRNIFDLAKFYGVSADYLLGMTENRQLGNISISDLHLSDAALSLLKDRKLNTLLLSELITHEQFRKLMLAAHNCGGRCALRGRTAPTPGCKVPPMPPSIPRPWSARSSRWRGWICICTAAFSGHRFYCPAGQEYTPFSASLPTLRPARWGALLA